jgi:hypothetical protein
MALTFSGLASIPHQETMKLRNFPEATPKAHFEGLNFISYRFSVLKASKKSIMWSLPCIVLTSISLMYTFMFRSIYSRNILFTGL